MVGACGAKVQMIKYTGGSPQQSRDGGLTGSLGTKKKILGVISIVVVLSLMMVGVRWLFFNVIKSSQMLGGLVEGGRCPGYGGRKRVGHVLCK